MPKITQDLILVGVGTTLGDFLFHYFETSPMEVPVYFAAKFLWAIVATYLVARYFAGNSLFEKGVIGGIIFDVLVGIYYAVAYFTQNPNLSCCFINAPAVSGVPQITYFMAGYYPITGNVLAFIGLHFLVFFLSYEFVYKYT